MSAWAQSLGTVLGGAGNDLAEAKFGLQDRDLAIAQARAQLQSILTGIAGSQIQQQGQLQQQKIAAAPHVQVVPTIGGGYATISTPAFGGPSSTQQVVSAPPPPEALTDAGIERAAQNLPSWVPKDNFIATVKGLRDMGQREEALKQIATISNKRVPLSYTMVDAGTAQQLAQQAGMALPPSQTGWYKLGYDPYTQQPMSFEANAQRGLLGSVSSSTDPAGLTTTTTRRPLLTGGASTQGGSAAPRATAVPTPLDGIAKRSSTDPAASPLNPQPKADSPTAAVSLAKARYSAYGLDSEGHIPDTAHLNPQIREAANQLLDGADVNHLPQKIREAAAAAARPYGWSQGRFTPKEQVMLREATSILNQMAASSALKVLDATLPERLQLGAALSNPDRMSLLGKAGATAASMGMSDQQAEFARLYKQAIGRISGLSQLVRSNRPTEQTIERLKQEVPNPWTTRDSGDAIRQLQLIQNEISLALQRGTFGGTEDQQGTGSVAPPPGFVMGGR